MAKSVRKNKKAIKQRVNLFATISTLIQESKQRVHSTINHELTLLYWNIGKLIQYDILINKRAGYGEKIIAKLSARLTVQFGKGWSQQQLWNCLYTVETFPSNRILSTLSRELSWSHLKELVYLKNKLQRTFYLEMAIAEK